MDKIDTAYNDTLKGINFDKIEQYMKSVNWKYAGKEVDVLTLMTTVNELFISAKETFLDKNASTMCSSGGFQVNIWKWGEVQIHFSIEDSFAFFGK